MKVIVGGHRHKTPSNAWSSLSTAVQLPLWEGYRHPGLYYFNRDQLKLEIDWQQCTNNLLRHAWFIRADSGAGESSAGKVLVEQVPGLEFTPRSHEKKSGRDRWVPQDLLVTKNSQA